MSNTLTQPESGPPDPRESLRPFLRLELASGILTLLAVVAGVPLLLWLESRAVQEAIQTTDVRARQQYFQACRAVQGLLVVGLLLRFAGTTALPATVRRVAWRIGPRLVLTALLLLMTGAACAIDPQRKDGLTVMMVLLLLSCFLETTQMALIQGRLTRLLQIPSFAYPVAIILWVLLGVALVLYFIEPLLIVVPGFFMLLCLLAVPFLQAFHLMVVARLQAD